jgi:hypothetical protein
MWMQPRPHPAGLFPRERSDYITVRCVVAEAGPIPRRLPAYSVPKSPLKLAGLFIWLRLAALALTVC